jgi:hypothetical protein
VCAITVISDVMSCTRFRAADDKEDEQQMSTHDLPVKGSTRFAQHGGNGSSVLGATITI